MIGQMSNNGDWYSYSNSGVQVYCDLQSRCTKEKKSLTENTIYQKSNPKEYINKVLDFYGF